MKLHRPRKIGLLVLPILLLTGAASLDFPALFNLELTVTKANSQGLSWDAIFQIFRRKKVRGGSRGGYICTLAPDRLYDRETTVKVWSVKPLFAWKGNLEGFGRIKVKQFGVKKPLWEAAIATPDSSELLYQEITYQGEALQPGQSYTWELSIARKSQRPTTYSPVIFDVIDATERDELDADLERIESQLSAQRSPAEVIAWHRASYFAERELWADALREASSVKERSPALQQFTQNIANLFCASSNSTQQ
jgi:hypothetical protein